MQINSLNSFKKKAIRTYIRALRRNIHLSEQYIAAQLITNRLLALKCLHKSKNIAIYIAFDGEIQTYLAIQFLLSMNKRIYLPIISIKQPQTLLFAQYTLSTPLIQNLFNIYEPKFQTTTILPVKMLDIIFIPLVAFDEKKNRIGMGGGFYDKTLSYLNKKNHCVSIGLGFDFQKIPTEIFPVGKKDIKLSYVITPHHIY